MNKEIERKINMNKKQFHKALHEQECVTIVLWIIRNSPQLLPSFSVRFVFAVER